MLVSVLIFGGDIGIGGAVITVRGIHSIDDVDSVGGDCSDGHVCLRLVMVVVVVKASHFPEVQSP